MDEKTCYDCKYYNSSDSMCVLFEMSGDSNSECIMMNNNPDTDRDQTIVNYTTMLLDRIENAIERYRRVCDMLEVADTNMDILTRELTCSVLFPRDPTIPSGIVRQTDFYKGAIQELEAIKDSFMFIRSSLLNKDINLADYIIREPYIEGGSRQIGYIMTKILHNLGYMRKPGDNN